jgi:hypothetical protein
MLKCSVNKKYDFGNEVTGYDGSHVWKKLHDTVETIECDYCKGKGIKLIKGLHDSVNVHLGKKMKYPNDFDFLLNHVLYSENK